MQENANSICPECDLAVEQPQYLLARREFIGSAATSAAGLMALGAVGTALAPLQAADTKTQPVKKPAKPAEELIKELFSTLKEDQKKAIVLPWDHGYVKGKNLPTRLGMYNSPINKTISECFGKSQQELLQKILRAICSDDDGYRRISRNGNFDGSRAFENCGANIFGDPSGKNKYSWVFTGHHLTVRCDGNSEEGAAFGGPMYYGHSPNGYSDRNLFYYQTKSVMSVFDALTEKQRKVAILDGSPGEGQKSVEFRPATQKKPGLSHGEMNQNQQKLVAQVMRDLLSPYRKEDADEVMQIVKKNGGFEKIHLAFYKDSGGNGKQPWSFWRLEGPGFVWNYRVLPHVHTFVNISSKA